MSREDDISKTQNDADLSNNEDDDTLASMQTKCRIKYKGVQFFGVRKVDFKATF